MKRICLKCGNIFNSKGIHNRLCFNCVYQNALVPFVLKIEFPREKIIRESIKNAR